MNDEELWTSQLLPALERHQLGKCIIIPVLATPTNYAGTAFGGYMPLPRNKKFISEHPSKDTALYEIVEEIKKIIEPK
jgi:hypothetical protein